MAELIPEQVAVKDLPDLLNVPRSRVYTLMDALSINSIKVGRSAYIDQGEFFRLEAVQKFIRSGGTVSEWLKANPIEPQKVSYDTSLVKSSDTLGQVQETNLELVLATLERILPRVLPTSGVSTKEKLETFTLAAREGLTLSNIELAEILHLSTKTLSKKRSFTSNGFTFTKTKEAGNIYWRIEKTALARVDQ